MSMKQIVGIILHNLETLKDVMITQQNVLFNPWIKYSFKDSVKLSNFIQEKSTTNHYHRMIQLHSKKPSLNHKGRSYLLIIN
jgi:hypothetical protein